MNEKKIMDMFEAMGMNKDEEMSAEEVEMMKHLIAETSSDLEVDQMTQFFNVVGSDFFEVDILETAKSLKEPVFELQTEEFSGKEFFYFVLKERGAERTEDDLKMPVLGETADEALSYAISHYEYTLNEGYNVPVLLTRFINEVSDTAYSIYIEGDFTVEIDNPSQGPTKVRFPSFEKALEFVTTA